MVLLHPFRDASRILCLTDVVGADWMRIWCTQWIADSRWQSQCFIHRRLVWYQFAYPEGWKAWFIWAGRPYEEPDSRCTRQLAPLSTVKPRTLSKHVFHRKRRKNDQVFFLNAVVRPTLEQRFAFKDVLRIPGIWNISELQKVVCGIAKFSLTIGETSLLCPVGKSNSGSYTVASEAA